MFEMLSYLEGVVEIWLTSEDLGAYGHDIGVTLPQLLWKLVEVIPEGARMRLGMTNPPYILEHLEVSILLLSQHIQNWYNLEKNHLIKGNSLAKLSIHCNNIYFVKWVFSNSIQYTVCVMTIITMFTGDGQDSEAPASVLFPPCPCTISVWQRTDGHEAGILPGGFQTCSRLSEGKVHANN